MKSTKFSGFWAREAEQKLNGIWEAKTLNFFCIKEVPVCRLNLAMPSEHIRGYSDVNLSCWLCVSKSV